MRILSPLNILCPVCKGYKAGDNKGTSYVYVGSGEEELHKLFFFFWIGFYLG